MVSVTVPLPAYSVELELDCQAGKQWQSGLPNIQDGPPERSHAADSKAVRDMGN